MSTVDNESLLFEKLLALHPDEREKELRRLAETNAETADRLRRLLRAHDATHLRTHSGELAPLPATIGPYRVLDRLGEGGMGEVYLCEQREPIKRALAVKVLKPGIDSRAVIARFDAERQALALMNHPGIARIIDAGTTERDLPYFAMEYVPGLSLTQYCDDNQLSLDERLRLFVQVCHAVQHAHQKGVIHRDIKPTNILVTEASGKPLPKIIDFGIAKATGAQLVDGTLHTRIGDIVGTPEYMSPEQAGVEGQDVDTRSDIYSLGVVLYRLLTGGVPLSFGTNPVSLLNIHQRLRNEPPVPPSRRLRSGDDDAHARRSGFDSANALSRRLRRDLDWIVMKALEKDRARRYASAAEFAADIERHLRNEPVLAARPGAAYVVGKFVRRHALATAAASAFLLLLVGFSGYASWQAHLLGAERDKVAAEAERARHVTQFLVNVFRAADPYAGGATSLTAQEILERATRKLHEDPPVSAAMRADIERALGEIRINLGDIDSGTALLEDALQSARAAYPPQSIELLALRGVYGAALSAQGKLLEAEAELRAVAEQVERLHGRDNTVWIAAMRSRGGVLLQMRRLPEAVALFNAVYPVIEQQLGRDSFEALAVRNNLAVAYQSMQRDDEAVQMLEQLHADAVRVLGPLHPLALGAATNLSTAYEERGEPQRAIAILSEVLTDQTARLGAEHPDTLITRQNLAMLKPHDQYIEETREILETRRRTLGDHHPQTLNSTVNLAWALSTAGAGIEEREPLVIPALRALKQTVAPSDALLQNAQLLYAEIRIAQGRYEEAAAELEALAESGFRDETLIDEPTFLPLWEQPQYRALRDRLTGISGEE